MYTMLHCNQYIIHFMIHKRLLTWDIILTTIKKKVNTPVVIYLLVPGMLNSTVHYYVEDNT